MNRKEFYNTLNEDAKTKINARKAGKEKMDDDLLEGVSGGAATLPQLRQCPYCTFTYYDFRDLVKHVEEKHPEEM